MSSFSSGPLTAPILVIGESPEKSDITKGYPLSGFYGIIFNSCLLEAGLVKGLVRIENIFSKVCKKVKRGTVSDCIVNAENGTVYFYKGSLTEEGRLEVAFFKERVKHLNPKVIVTLGSAALFSLAGFRGVLKYRGSFLITPENSILPGRKLIPTIHPSFIQQGNPAWSNILSHDLRRAAQIVNDNNWKPVSRTLYINPSFSDAIDYLNECSKTDKIATDIEIYGRSVSCFSITSSIKEAMCISLFNEVGGNKYTLEQEAQIWLRYAQILGSSKIKKVNQNIIFDLQFLAMNNKIIPSPPYADTMVAHRILYPDLPASLQFLTSLYTDIPYYKDDRKLWAAPLRDVEVFWRYSCRDSIAALEVWDALEEDLILSDCMFTHDLVVSRYNALIYMMVDGLEVGLEELSATKQQINKDILFLEGELKKITGIELNVNSNKQCCAYFYTKKKYTEYKSGGKASCDELALSRLIRKYGSKEADLILKIRNLKTLLSKYIDCVLDPDDKFRSSYNPMTRFGRFSASQTIHKTGGNFQNLDPRFRKFLIPDRDS